MRMKTRMIAAVIVALFVAGLFFAVPVAAKGAEKVDVTWVHGGITYKAIFLTTGSGIIHQFRYMPNELHVVYKPVDKFPNMPRGEGWTGPHPKSGLTGGYAVLEAIFTAAEYWAHVNYQGP